MDVDFMLADCCGCWRPASILVGNQRQEAIFASVADYQITFHLLSKDPVDFGPFSQACVTIVYRQRHRVFLSSIRSCGPQTLALSLPSRIATTEDRLTFRFPLLDAGSELSLQLVANDCRQLNPQAFDISYHGIGVEFYSNADPELPLESQHELHLSLGGHSATLQAIVRRHAGARYGLFFPETADEGGVASTDSYAQIVKEVERRWLAQRMGCQ